MKVDFRKTVKDYKGVELQANGIPVMMADVICKVLFEVGVGRQAGADDKYMAYKLCNRISRDGEVELGIEECALIVRLCGEVLAAGVYGQVRDLVEGN